jgi:hypothetical protein
VVGKLNHPFTPLLHHLCNPQSAFLEVTITASQKRLAAQIQTSRSGHPLEKNVAPGLLSYF